MVSLIIPAFREAERIGLTLAGVQRGAEALDEPIEVVVVDDGSDDGTAEQALAQTQSHHQVIRSSGHQVITRVVRLEQNQGKGAALARGLAAVRGEWIVMLDADLGETAAEFPRLLAPVRAGLADMTIAVFGDRGTRGRGDGATGRWGDPITAAEGLPLTSSVPLSPRLPVPLSPRPSVARGGFGLALRTARWGVARLTGRVLRAPLSGQRAFVAVHLPLLTPLEPGFGLEVGLDIDALWAGLRVMEVPTSMAHAATGRDWAGFRHRGRQLAHILRALWRRQKAKGKRQN
jgi:uncharacterized protein YheU (UPF0270 family)